MRKVYLVLCVLAMLLFAVTVVVDAKPQKGTGVFAAWFKGAVQTINSVSIRALMYDNSEDVLFATGTTVPTDASDGYSKGGIFIDTDVATGTSGLYQNIGTSSSSLFKLIANGSSGGTSLSSLEAGADKQIIIGDADGVATWQTMSGGATITNAGVIATAANHINASRAYINTTLCTVPDAHVGTTCALPAGSQLLGALPHAGVANTRVITKALFDGTNLVINTSGVIPAGGTSLVVNATYFMP